MAKLLDDRKIAGKVRLVYIDPPYSTQTAFHSRKLSHAYEDNLTGAEFIEFLRARLIMLRELLAEDGSIYLHLDEKMIFHIKVIMDEIFGLNNYKNCIVRKKCNPKNYTRKKIWQYFGLYPVLHKIRSIRLESSYRTLDRRPGIKRISIYRGENRTQVQKSAHTRTGRSQR